MPDGSVYALSSADTWAHIIQPPQAFWEAYCGAKLDWKIGQPNSEDKICPYCLVLKESDDAEKAPSV